METVREQAGSPAGGSCQITTLLALTEVVVALGAIAHYRAQLTRWEQGGAAAAALLVGGAIYSLGSTPPPQEMQLSFLGELKGLRETLIETTSLSQWEAISASAASLGEIRLNHPWEHHALHDELARLSDHLRVRRDSLHFAEISAKWREALAGLHGKPVVVANDVGPRLLFDTSLALSRMEQAPPELHVTKHSSLKGDDLDQVLDILQESFGEVTSDMRDRRWSSYQADIPDRTLLLARDETNKVVAMVVYSQNEAEPDRSPLMSCLVRRASHARFGVFDLFKGVSNEVSLVREAPYLFCDVDPKNRAARRLYEAAGFQATSSTAERVCMRATSKQFLSKSKAVN